MFPCFCRSSTTDDDFRPPTLNGYGVESSSAQISPTVNLSRAYTLAVQTRSFGEIWNKIHRENSFKQNVDMEDVSFVEQPLQLEEVLKPSREDVEETLSDIKIDAFTQLVVNFFAQTEESAQNCLLLSESVRRAQHLYSPLQNLVDTLLSDSLSEDECDLAFKVFLRFEKIDNPFPDTDSNSISGDMHDCYSELKRQLDLRIRKSRSKLHLIRRAAALCSIVTVAGAVVIAVLVAIPALVLVATPTCPILVPRKITKKESAHLLQLDDASRETFVLKNHLETLNCLVKPLHNSVEGFKCDVRFVLERGKESYNVREVVKRLREKNEKFLDQMTLLEDHLCLCFAAINRVRSILLAYVIRQQVYSS